MLEKFKSFFYFKSLITESILRYVFMGLCALSAVTSVIGIISSWVGAFNVLRWSTTAFLSGLIVVPILILVGLAVSIIIMRIMFEAVLVRFLIYREVQQLNEKVGSKNVIENTPVGGDS